MSFIKACIFDLDGVIVDTAKYHYKAWRTIANRFDVDFTEEDNEQLKGVSRIDSLEIILRMGKVEMNQKDKDKYLHAKNELYLDYISEMNEEEILPGVVSFLDQIIEKGWKVGLGSASKNAVTILKQVGLYNIFECIIDGNGVVKGKPDPEVFLNGAKALRTSPAETVIFEDSKKGIEAAINGGFISVGIGSPKHLSNADIVIKGFENFSVNELCRLLEEAGVLTL